MDNNKVLPNLLKNASKNDEARQTQVFVLPPELLKGLLLQNKIPKINDPEKLTLVTTSKPENIGKDKRKVEQSSDSLAIIANQISKIEKKNEDVVKEVIQNLSANIVNPIEAKNPVNKKKNQESSRKIEESATNIDFMKQIQTTDKTESIQENVEGAKKTSGRRKRSTKISKQSKAVNISNEKHNLRKNRNKKHIESDNLSVEISTKIISEVVNELSPEKLVCLDSNKSSENEKSKIQNKDILSSRSKEKKEEENIDKTCMQNEKPNLEITDESLIGCSTRKTSKNLKGNEIAISKHNPKVTDKQKLASSSRNELPYVINESDIITNGDIQSNLENFNKSFNTTELNQTRSSRQRRITNVAKPYVLDNTSNVHSKKVNKLEVNNDDLSTKSSIKPINEGNNLGLKLEKEQINIHKIEKLNTNRRKRISRIPNLRGIPKNSTETQELDGQEKYTNSLPVANFSKSHVETINKSMSDNLTSLKCNEPSEKPHCAVQRNETITTNTIMKEEKSNINTNLVETEQPSLEIRDEFPKSIDVNQARCLRRARISKISVPKEVVNASSDNLKSVSQNKDVNFYINESTQKSCLKTNIEKYKKLCTEETIDASFTSRVDLDKTNIFQSCTDIGNLNFNILDESFNSTNDNNCRYPRKRRIYKVPNLAKDKISNDKSKTRDQSKDETKIKDFSVENCIEPQTEESTITSSKQIVCSNESKEITNKIIKNITTIMSDSSIEKEEVNLDKTSVNSVISDSKIPNAFLEFEVKEPIKYSRTISEMSNQDKSDNVSKNVDKQETFNQYKNCLLSQNNVFDCDESNKVCTSKIQDEPPHLTVSQSRYSRRKRITKITKPSIIANTAKIKHKASNNENQVKIIINDLPTENYNDSNMAEKPYVENVASLNLLEYDEVNSNIVQSNGVVSSDPNVQTDDVKTDMISSETDITINDRSIENCIDSKIVEIPSLEHMASLDSNKSEVHRNTVQNIKVHSSYPNIQTENINTICPKNDMTIKNVPTENCSDMEMVEKLPLEGIDSLDLNKSNKVKKNIIQNSKGLSFHSNIAKECTKGSTDSAKIEILNSEISNISFNEMSNNENLPMSSTSDEHENCEENHAFNSRNQEIEIIEEIEYIIEEVLEEEYTEASDHIIHNFTKSDRCEVEKSPIKKIPIDSELNVSTTNIFNRKESLIQDLPLATSCENNYLTSTNNSIDLELDKSDEFSLVKKDNEKVHVYVNKRKIKNEIYSKENHNKFENSSIEIKNTNQDKNTPMISVDESEKLTTKFTDLPIHEEPSSITRVRRYSARSCKRNSILNSTTTQQEQEKNVKTRNRSKSTNQVKNNESYTINTRTRSSSATINSSSSKQCKSEDSKISKKSSIPAKAFKQEIKRKHLNENAQVLVEDSAMGITKDKYIRGKAIHAIEQKTEKDTIVENRIEINHNDATNLNHENHKGKLCINSAGSNVVANEAEINLNYVNDEEDVTIDIKEILDSLAMDDSQDEDDSLLLCQNNKIMEDEKTKSIEENSNKGNMETICEYNFNISTNKVHIENIPLKEFNDSHNDKRQEVIQDKTNYKNDITIQHGKESINDVNLNKTLETCIKLQSKSSNVVPKEEKLLADDTVEDKNTENMFINIKASETVSKTVECAKNVNDSSEGHKHEMIIGKFHDNEVTEGTLEAIENPKSLNLEFNDNLDTFTDNNKLSMNFASENVQGSKDKLNTLDVSESSETKNCTKNNIKIETYSEYITEKNWDTSKESDIDNLDDNYESVNVPFENYDCSSISSTENSNEISNKDILSVKNLRDLEKKNNDSLSKPIDSEVTNIKCDNNENKNQDNSDQINIFTECIKDKAKRTNNSILESDNNTEKTITELNSSTITSEKNTKMIPEKFDEIVEYNISIDKMEHKNNSLLESNSTVDNPLIVSEKLSKANQSNMDVVEIEDKHNEIKDMRTMTLISTQKKRGRPPKAFKKIIERKSAAENIPHTENNLHKEVGIIDSEQKSLEMPGRKRRSCRLTLLEEPRRSTRHKTDGNSKEILNSNSNQKRSNRQCTKEEVKSQMFEENADIGVNNNKDENINKLLSENTEHQVKRPRKSRSKSKIEKTSIFNNQESHTPVKNKNNADSSITLKTVEQQSQSTSLVLSKKGIANETDAKSTNCDTAAEININDSTELTENDAIDTVLTVTRKRKRSTIKVIIQEDDEIESKKDSMRNLDTPTVEEKNKEKELSDGSNSDADGSVILPTKRRKGPLGPYRKRRRGKKCRGRPSGVQRKNVCDSDYVPHHSHLNRTPKKETPKIDSSAELNMKKIVTCGKCDVEIAKNQWAHHNLMTHNNTGWLKGSEKPDFENDEKLYRTVINLAHKKRKKTLVCEQCKVIKRSVAGYLSHLTFCGKTEEEMQALMVTCPVCHAVTKPSSVEYHERMHRMEAEAKERMPEIDIENIDLGPRSKRKAAEKAVNKISEFTALVKEDKEHSGPFDKKLKTNSSMKKMIQKPQLEKKIPSTSVNKWRKDLASGQNATCSQVGCQFTSNSFDEIKNHYSTCNFTPRESYLCKICRFQSATEKEVLEHALEKHSFEDEDANLSLSDAESSSTDNSSDNEADTRIQPQNVMKKFFYKESTELSNKLFKFIFKDGACHTKFNKTYFGGFQWTLEFERENYKFNLFEEYAPNNFELLNLSESYSYLPEVEQSMPMTIIKTGNNNEIQPEWKTWKRFEGQCCEDNPTFFVGGPVWALAWLPIPTSMSLFENLSQFIAISTHPTMDATYSVGESYSGKNIIQIWDVGNLNHKTNSRYSPKLAYAISHEGGTVWCLEWCPSGCYQHKDLPRYIDKNVPNKMGLLAAGCSDGCVRIYSLVFPEDLVKANTENIENNDEYSVYNTEPVLVLVVNKNMFDNKKQNWQVMKLSWSKEKNHNIIAAGFSNGYVALWNLSLKSPLLKSKKGNTVYLNSYRHFFAHHHAITMVHLIPQNNKRFLATASLDRLYKLWDLEDITNPKNTFKKSFVTDGAWLNHWCTAFVAYDDALSMGHNYSYCLPLRDYTYKYFNIFPTNSPSFSICTSDYGNSIANGTLAGEILAIFPQQLIYIRDMEKTLPRKRYISMVSTAELVDFQKVHEEKSISKDKEKEKVSSSVKKKDKQDDKIPYDFMPTTYTDSKDRFGIKFYDKLNMFRDQCMIKPKNQKKTLTIEMMKNTPVEQYPIMSVNRLSWNPNASSFLWLAAGYQNGFVRLMSFKSMASPAEWSKLLTSHIETLKSDCANSQSTKLDDR